MRHWQLQEAKAKLSEVVKSSVQDGPQAISVHGRTAAIVVSKADYERLTRRKQSFVALLRQSPLVGVDLPIERDRTPARKVRL